MTDGLMKIQIILLLSCLFITALAQQPQNPSPMVEHTRAHPRLKQESPSGRRENLEIGTLFLPAKLKLKSQTPLLIFFHGGSWLPEVAATQAGATAVLTIQLSAGSGSYAKIFEDSGRFERLIEEAQSKAGVKFSPLTLGGWSAGCQAVRELLKTQRYYELTARILLIDGIHTSYVGGKPGPQESQIEVDNLQIFVRYARDAIAGKKEMIVTHSEIFPGTFASTTETADYIVAQLGLKRRATVAWGPMQTQQLSEIRQGNFVLVGYAGNSAPDHVDQLHSLPDYLRWFK
jgi:hypothetical protein